MLALLLLSAFLADTTDNNSHIVEETMDSPTLIEENMEPPLFIEGFQDPTERDDGKIIISDSGSFMITAFPSQVFYDDDAKYILLEFVLEPFGLSDRQLLYNSCIE